jgi:hypothetical protein
MDSSRQRIALIFTLVGLSIGFAGTLLFYGQMVGISFLLFIALVLVALFGTLFALKLSLNPRNGWVCVPILFFASMLTFRDNSFLAFMNVTASIGLGTLLVAYLRSNEALDTASLGQMISASTGAALRSLTDPVAELIDTRRYLRQNPLQGRQGSVAVVRGVVFTLPIVLVFAVLLGSADQVFGKYLEGVFNAFDNIGEITSRMVLTAAIGWIAIGGLSYALARRYYFISREPSERGEADEDLTPEKRKNTPIILTMIETTMILGAVNLLFGAFVVVQFAYLFGGEAAIGEQSFTYSQYARRGFYELLAVTVLSLGMALFLDWVTIRRGEREGMLFKGLSVILSGLVGVMIVSASQRMVLYEQAFGFTDDRVYAHLFILWLGGLFVAFILHLFRVRKNIFAFGMLIVAIGYTGHLNLLNVDQYIAQENVQRWRNGELLDVCYLNSLSLDALPVVLEVREEVRETEGELYDLLNLWITRKWETIERAAPWTTLLSFNTSREYARATLAPMIEEVWTEVAELENVPYCYDYLRQ